MENLTMKLSTAEIEMRLGLSDRIVDVSPQGAHVGQDGRAMIVCSLMNNTAERDAGFLAIAIDGQNLSTAHIPKDMAPRFGWHCGAAEFENGLVFIHRRTRPSEDEMRAVYIPRTGMTWGEPQILDVTPDFPIRKTNLGHIKQVMPAAKGIGFGGTIAWPVEASTGDAESTVKSIAFFRPDVSNGRLNWSFWPQPPEPKNRLKRIFAKPGKNQSLVDFVRPNPHAFPTFQYAGGQLPDLQRMPNILSAAYDGTRLLIASDGATVIKKSGDRCTAISVVQADGKIDHLYLEDFVNSARPDANKKHDYQARFVSGGKKALLKSRYKATDPWDGGFALFDVTDKSLTVCAGPKTDDYRGPLEIIDNQALRVDFDEQTLSLSIRLEDIIFK